MRKQHLIDALLAEWGISKSLQIILLAIAAASIVVVVGVHLIPNNKRSEKEIIHL